MAFLISTQAYTQQSTAPAQTVDAWTYSMRTQVSMMGSATGVDRNTIIQTASGRRRSVDTDSSDVNQSSGHAAPPVRKIEIATYSGKDTIITILDTVRHTYRHFQNVRDARSFAALGYTTHADADTARRYTDISATMDSVGIGPMRLGHQTVHYRQVMHLTMRPTSRSALSTATTTVDTIDYDITPDLHDSALTTDQLVFGAMDNPIEQNAPGVESVWRAALKKLPRGFPLHVERRMVSTLPFGAGLMILSFSTDVDRISHGPVNAALFTTPRSYTLAVDSAPPALPAIAQSFPKMSSHACPPTPPQTSTQLRATKSTPPGDIVNAWSVTALMTFRIVSPMDTLGEPNKTRLTVIRTPRASRITFDADSVTEVQGSPASDACVQVVLTRESEPGTPGTFLDTVRHTYRPLQEHWSVMNMSGLRLSDMLPGSNVSDLSISVDSIGAGPVLHGHPTVHYRQTRKGTLTMGATASATFKIVANDTLDIDIAMDIRDSLLSVGRLPFRHMLDLPGWIASAPSLDSSMQAAARKYPPGLPLRFEKRLAMTTGLAGMNVPATTLVFSIDVESWSRDPINAALLTVPASYTRASASQTPASGSDNDGLTP